MLEEIVLGENVSAVAQGAFKDCVSLQSLTMPRVDTANNFNEYYFGLVPELYVLNGTGDYNLYPDKINGYSWSGGIAQVPAPDAKWYYQGGNITENGKQYVYSKKPLNVTSWEERVEINVAVRYKVPKKWTADFYYRSNSSLDNLTITDQLISVFDKVFDGCGCEVDILQKFPVESVSVVGRTELFLDEFSLEDYTLRARHTDGWEEDFPLADFLTEADKNKLQQSGTYTFNLSYGGKSCEFVINLKLHTFTDAALDDKDFIYDGTVKQLEVTGVPEGAAVKYENNGQTQPGTYTITATIKKEYYETKVLTATLRIDETSYAIKYVLNMENADNPNPSRYETGKTLLLQSAVSESFEFGLALRVYLFY